MTLKVATWNTQWAIPDNDRGRRVATRLTENDPDVIVLTEGCRALLPPGGYSADAGSDWGYSTSPHRRKVIVWSRYPLSEIATEDHGAASGRLVMATATTDTGEVRIIGVCIPWSSAHVSTGRADAKPWSEHMEYLDQLDHVISNFGDEQPAIIAGDFNQRIPRVRQPIRVAERLAEVLNSWTVHTEGDLENCNLIDHIASNGLLECRSVVTWPGNDSIGQLSDHSGASCEFSAS